MRLSLISALTALALLSSLPRGALASGSLPSSPLAPATTARAPQSKAASEPAPLAAGALYDPLALRDGRRLAAVRVAAVSSGRAWLRPAEGKALMLPLTQIDLAASRLAEPASRSNVSVVPTPMVFHAPSLDSRTRGEARREREEAEQRALQALREKEHEVEFIVRAQGGWATVDWRAGEGENERRQETVAAFPWSKKTTARAGAELWLEVYPSGGHGLTEIIAEIRVDGNQAAAVTARAPHNWVKLPFTIPLLWPPEKP